jgi:hypothetical protein
VEGPVITTSPAFLDAIRQPHNYASQATIIPTSGDPFDVDIDDGSVIVDRTADHRRQLSLTLSNALLYPQTPVDPVAPYGAEVVVKLGIRQANGSQVLVQLGVFRIEDASRDTPGGGVTITGWDRSRQLLDERFLAPRKFAATQAVTLIQQLITEVYPDAVFIVTTADTTMIPKHVVDRDRWAEVQRLAQVIGCEVYPDEQGRWVIQDVPNPATAQVVWTVDAGENGVLIQLTDTVSREGAPNIVVVNGEPKDGSTPVKSALPHGYDTDITSPTYYLGAYGEVPRFYTSPHITTQAQANRVADALLSDHIGLARTISFGIVPNPALEAGDLITVRRPDGTAEQHIIDMLEVPLSPSGVMTGETRLVDWNAE